MLTVSRCDREEWTPFILHRHYAKRIPSVSFAFGLFDDAQMIGCVLFGSPASPYLCKGVAGAEHSSRVIELNRLALNSNAPKNSASMLVGRALKMLPKGYIVVSYADTGKGHVGYVYQATNWIYTGCTKERTDMASANGKHSRHHLGDRSNRVPRSAKHRYVFCTDKRDIKLLQYPSLPYPKGDTSKTDGQDVVVCRLFGSAI